jgi:anti-sigma factor RsiW
MTDHLGERLSAYLDGELTGEALAAAEAHLAGCAECRALLDDLRRLTARAGSLDDRPPGQDLWPGVAARLAGDAALPAMARRPPRRLVFSIPQLAAAGIALAALSAGAAVLATHAARSGAPATAALVDRAPSVRITSLASAKGVESYDAAIHDLETTLAARRGKLDTGTVRVVEQSLAVINRAIAQAEAALAQDPNSMYLNTHLEQALGRKLELLRRVTSLVTAS